MDVLASVEYDPLCTAVHRFNFPRTGTVCADASTLSAAKLKRAITKGWAEHGYDGDPIVDVVVGGPPCQGFSVIGKRAFDDPRNQLVFVFARLVGALKPRYFVMENVPGIASVRAGEAIDSDLLLDLLNEEFESYDYVVDEPRELNAYNFSVPQYRQRTLLVGRFKGEEPILEPQPETRGRTRQGGEAPTEKDYDDGLELCPTVSDAIGDLPNLDDLDDSEVSDVVALTPGLLTEMEEKASKYACVLRGIDRDDGDLSYPRKWQRSQLTSSFRTVHADDVAERFEDTNPGSPESVSRFFRLHPDGVSSTLRAGTHYDRGSFNAPRPIHYEHPRVISVREAARLHGYPDWFRLHWTKWHGFRQVGNSLPPRMARAVAARIVEALEAEPKRPAKAIELGDPELLYLENVQAAKKFGADMSRIPRNSQRTRSDDAVLRPKTIAVRAKAA
jgi:DNA (cytosine-5)-methyltransferase 1